MIRQYKITMATWHFDLGWQNIACMVGLLGTFAFVFGFDGSENQILRMQRLKSFDSIIGLVGKKKEEPKREDEAKSQNDNEIQSD